jgi:hypothetical protein
MVQNLESKNKTPDNNANAEVEERASSFVEGRLGVTAQVNFHLKSPWKALGALIRKIAA